MPEHMLMPQGGLPDAPLPHKDYTMHLLQYAAENGLLLPETLNALRDGLHKAAAERAAQYTAGKSATVTRKQAEAFYASVFTQLDAALLTLESDAEALEALRTQPLTALLEQGAVLTISAYDFAKEHFRRAWKLTKPVQTSFFAALLKDFEQFCTKYDARFRAADTKVAFTYPLLGDLRITESGVPAVHRYYTALLREGELLHLFDADAVRALMQRYADKFLTSADMIAENLAELVLRHWLICMLCGETGLPVDVTAEMIGTVQAKYAAASQEQMTDVLCAQLELLPDSAAETAAYCRNAMPAVAAVFCQRMQSGRLAGWLAPVDM